MNIIQKYNQLCVQPSDINEHLSILKATAERCNSVTEFGVRNPTSTYAFLAGCNKVISYDLFTNESVEALQKECNNWRFILGNTIEITIEPTDFLFIDTHHKYSVLSKELELHADKVKKYIGFHDTTTFGYRDESEYNDQPQKVYGDGPGLMLAIEHFLSSHPEWRIDYKTNRNNGLMILRRMN